MIRTLLRRTAVGVLGLAAVLFSVFGTQPVEVGAQANIFANVGCVYGDYACYYSRTGVVQQGYPTIYNPNQFSYNPAFFSNTYQPAFFSNTYQPAFFNKNNAVFFNGVSYPAFYGNRTYFGYRFGGVPDRFFTSVGCNVGNYTCLFDRT